MKFLTKAVSLLAGLTAALSAMASPTNSLTFQNVTFNSWAVDGDTMVLQILNATHATGNWTGVNYLSAFEIKGIGNVTNANLVSGPGTTLGGAGYFMETDDQGLSASVGCKTGGTPGACFFAVPPVPLTDSMTWTIDFAGTGLDFSLPHLKVQFLISATQSKATGDLLSKELTAVPVVPVPEPHTLSLLLAGIGLIGFGARRRAA